MIKDKGQEMMTKKDEFEKMAEIIDPLAYKDRLKMPKLVISATGDEFFHPDDSYNWFDQMKGKTYLRPGLQKKIILC